MHYREYNITICKWYVNNCALPRKQHHTMSRYVNNAVLLPALTSVTKFVSNFRYDVFLTFSEMLIVLINVICKSFASIFTIAKLSKIQLGLVQDEKVYRPITSITSITIDTCIRINNNRNRLRSTVIHEKKT